MLEINVNSLENVCFTSGVAPQALNVIPFSFYCSKDSVVTEKINYDLLKAMHGIQTGVIPAPSLIGSSFISKTNEDIPKAMDKDCS